MFEKRKIRKAFELIKSTPFPTRVAAFEKLLDNGVNANARLRIGNEDRTLLDWAIKQGAGKYVEILIARGAVVRDSVLSFLVEECSAYQSKDVFDVLLRNGLDLSKYDNTLLLKVIRKRHSEILKELLINGFEINKTPKDGLAAVIAALRSYNDDVLDIVLACNPNVNGEYEGVTPLEHAIDRKKSEVIGKILDAGADINRPMNGCANAYEYAAKKSSECLQYLHESKKRRAAENFREWSLTAPSEVTRQTVQQQTGYARIEIFNFAGSYTQINRNMESGIESSAIMPIDSLRGTELFRQAAQELLDRGGAMPETNAPLPMIVAKKRTSER